MPSSLSPSATLDPAFVALLCCPNCASRPPLALTAAEPEATETASPTVVSATVVSLVCGVCHRRYPIVDGLPDLRPDGQSAPAPAASHK